MNLDCIVAVILNRNLGKISDKLEEDLQSLGISKIVIVDSSTSINLRSKNATIIQDSPEALREGLRINRGFNLGIASALENTEADWILCLPVDTEIVKFNVDALLSFLSKNQEIQAVCPIERGSPYAPMINQSGVSLVWNLPEGPILLKSEFARRYQYDGNNSILDNTNFRGYLSFIELALRIYGNHGAMAVTNLIEVHEREDYLLHFSELMKTEPLDINKELLIKDGLHWLNQKYGLQSRWALENIVRLTFEDYLSANPKLQKFAIY